MGFSMELVMTGAFILFIVTQFSITMQEFSSYSACSKAQSEVLQTANAFGLQSFRSTWCQAK